MAAQFPMSINIMPAGLLINGSLIEVLTVSALSEVLGAPRVVPPEDPAPNEFGKLQKTIVIWDSAGIFVFTKGGDEASELDVRLSQDPKGEAKVKFDFHRDRPNGIFEGTFTVDGRAPLESIPAEELRNARVFLETTAGDWCVNFTLNQTECGQLRDLDDAERFAKSGTEELANVVREAAHPFSWVDISYEGPAPVKKPSGKWTLKATTEPVLQLSSFPLRLAVIQELMYEQNALQPRFDVHEFAQDQGAHSFDPNVIGHEMIPSVRDWFSELPIPARLAERVETLMLDGGNDIYLQLIPQWDGEDDSFVIESLREEDLAPFTHLKRVEDIGGFLGARARATLTERGIEVES